MQRAILPTIQADPHPSVAFADNGHSLTLTATADLAGVATGRFADPAIAVVLPLDLAPGTRLLGFSYTQFAMPVWSGPERPNEWDPAVNIKAPAVLLPLLIQSPVGRVCLLAPLDSWHEQVLAVDQDDHGVRGVRWGWHGDLETIPAGTTSTLGVFEADSAGEALRVWGDLVRTRAGIDRYGTDDPIRTHLSYWTDNGAAYWYRTEPGVDLATTLETKTAELADLGVELGSFELDSWFYRHERSRPITEVGYLSHVPPTGMLEWTPRHDALPDGIESLRDRIGNLPLVLHSRHISPASPYLAEGDWWVDTVAHPADPAFFRRWFADAASWGATCIEQDWMIMTWFGCRPLRAVPGRGMAWLRGLNDAAARHDMSVLFCMASPADLCAAAELDRVIAVRSSDDYRFADDPARLWRWYLAVNRLADALGLPVFKDCFFSRADGDGIDGDRHAEVEALLSALSGGMAGIGDRIGRTDPAIVRRVVGDDGRLALSERPLALCDGSLFDRPDDGRITWAESGTGAWRYVVALHLDESTDALVGTLDLGSEMLVYDWRAQTAVVGDAVEVQLEYRDWALFVCCPIERATDGTAHATIGDPERYATMAGRPIRHWSVEQGVFDL